ncbi:unnamed protein product [Spirodela intermedia]|uniref:Uncharacterized protein n=1 Tax=Spirodela intermedia TaxID=51605 RepID=A0A7I8J5Y3_SPIIN|nr:unnamed protein product [Spirodela intermedia]CAA6665501.1 unnamed protein product [Spirodela intermedia]
MKTLCFKLSSLIPKSDISKDSLTQQDHLDQAAAYIKTLRERIDRLKQKKELTSAAAPELLIGLRLPLVEIRALESTLEVVLICGPDRRSLFYEVIGVLEEEGADVVNASFSSVRCPRIGLEASRLSERLKGWSAMIRLPRSSAPIPHFWTF